MKRFIFLLIALLVTSVAMGTTFTVVTPGASDTTVVKSQTYPGTTGLTVTEVTPGASDTTAVIGLTYPRTVVPAGSIASPSLATDSVFNVHLGETVSVANGGTGSTSAAGALAALGGASLNGSSTVDFNAEVFTGSLVNNKIITVADGDTTPSVSGGSVLWVNNTGLTSITGFDDGVSGQVITLYISPSGGNTIITNFAYLTGGIAITCEPGEKWTAQFLNVGGTWFEISRAELS